jgi:Ni,Fe-hydrogenase III large subunit
LQSIHLLLHLLRDVPEVSLPLPDTTAPLIPRSLCFSLIEGWRGEICHIALTDARGELSYYKVKDPSLHNWYALSLAVRGAGISDFPVNNKSFNLSYCGHDL